MDELTRRDFLKMSAIAAVTAVAGCAPPPAPAPQPTPRPTIEAVEAWHKSVCRFCGTGCGVLLGVTKGQLVALRGDPDHPTTKGLVCAKALFLPKMVYSPDRLKKPQIRKSGKLVDATWEEAMTLVTDKFTDAIKTAGPDSIAYYGSGQALSE